MVGLSMPGGRGTDNGLESEPVLSSSFSWSFFWPSLVSYLPGIGTKDLTQPFFLFRLKN